MVRVEHQILTHSFFFRLANGVLGITWRLGFGVDNTNEPEGLFLYDLFNEDAHLLVEWQSHPATLNLPLTGAL